MSEKNHQTSAARCNSLRDWGCCEKVLLVNFTCMGDVRGVTHFADGIKETTIGNGIMSGGREPAELGPQGIGASSKHISHLKGRHSIVDLGTGKLRSSSSFIYMSCSLK